MEILQMRYGIRDVSPGYKDTLPASRAIQETSWDRLSTSRAMSITYPRMSITYRVMPIMYRATLSMFREM